MAKQIKVRFNLGRGENYMRWKVEWPDGRVEYHDPVETQIIMQYCILKNRRKTAMDIFLGANKTVCAWVLCENIAIRHDTFIKDESHKLSYNPRIAPYWTDNLRRNLDGHKFDHLHTIDYGIYIGH
jgi:hypothetical protein